MLQEAKAISPIQRDLDHLYTRGDLEGSKLLAKSFIVMSEMSLHRIYRIWTYRLEA